MVEYSDTKSRIAAAFRELAETQAFDKISINAIVKAARVGRNTFYYHFEDKYALVEWIFDREMTESNSAGYVGMPINVMEAMLNHHKYYINLFQSSAAPLLQDKINRLCRTIHKQELANALSEKQFNAADAEVLIEFFTNATVYTIVNWVKDGMTSDLDVYENDYSQLHLECLHYAIAKHGHPQAAVLHIPEVPSPYGSWFGKI